MRLPAQVGEAIIVGRSSRSLRRFCSRPPLKSSKRGSPANKCAVEMEMKRGKNSVKIKYDPKKMKQADLEKLLANAMETMRK